MKTAPKRKPKVANPVAAAHAPEREEGECPECGGILAHTASCTRSLAALERAGVVPAGIRLGLEPPEAKLSPLDRAEIRRWCYTTAQAIIPRESVADVVKRAQEIFEWIEK